MRARLDGPLDQRRQGVVVSVGVCSEALVKRAIPDAMALLDQARLGGR
ncbi:hypothetical protein [Streptomyces sp. NPDC001601]